MLSVTSDLKTALSAFSAYKGLKNPTPTERSVYAAAAAKALRDVLTVIEAEPPANERGDGMPAVRATEYDTFRVSEFG